MLVFIKSDHAQKGIHRFLESLTIHDKYKIVLVDTIEDTNKYEDHSAIFGGFLPRDLEANKTIKNKYYTFCSPLGQADLSDKEFYSIELKILIETVYRVRARKIKNVVTQSKYLSERFNFIYIPPVKINIEKHITFNTERKNYGFLGNNMRKHKNVANQLSAISKLTPKEKIVVANQDAYYYYGYLFECEFLSKDLKSDEAYYKEIASHRFCFQCSHSEAFDYQAFEYAFMGVPIIGSPCIDWIPFDNLTVSNPDNYREIYYKAQDLLDNKELYWTISEKLSRWAKTYNERNKLLLLDVLNKLEE